MKVLLFVLTILFVPTSFAQIIKEEVFNAERIRFENCFMARFCGDDIPVEIPGFQRNWDLEKKKSEFFNEIAARCLVPMHDLFRVAYSGSNGEVFEYYFKYGPQKVFSIDGCTPTKNFLTMLYGECVSDSPYHSSLDVLKKMNGELRAQALNDTTRCTEEVELTNGMTGNKEKHVLLKDGFHKNTKTGKCDPICNPGQIYEKTLKTGYSENCYPDSNSEQVQQAGAPFPFYKKEICDLSYQGGTVDRKEREVANRTGIIGMSGAQTIGEFDPSYYETSCKFCVDKQGNHLDSSKKFNVCLKKGCASGSECSIDDCTDTPEYCERKCLKGQIKDEDGDCVDDKSKMCEYINSVYNYLQSGAYLQKYQNVRIQNCSPKQIINEVQTEAQNKIDQISELLAQCQSPDGLLMGTKNNLTMTFFQFGSIWELGQDLEKEGCFDHTKGLYSFDLNNLDVPPYGGFMGTPDDF